MIGWLVEHAILLYKYDGNHQLPLLQAAFVAFALYHCHCENYTDFQHKFCISAVLLYLSSAVFNGLALGIELVLSTTVVLAPLTVVCIDVFIAFLAWLNIVGSYLTQEEKKAFAQRTKTIV